MWTRYRVKEVWDDTIDEVLAYNIIELFRNGMNEEHYSEMIKDEKNSRPENCERLSVVRLNQLIWNDIFPGAQTADKKLQFLRKKKNILKAASI